VRASGFRCPKCGCFESEILQMTRDWSYMVHRCLRCESTYITPGGGGAGAPREAGNPERP
jgi:hypothetical protein